MANFSVDLTQYSFAEAHERPDGAQIENARSWEVQAHRFGFGPSLLSAHLEEALYVQPVSQVVLRVVDDKDDRHRLLQPVVEILDLHREEDVLLRGRSKQETVGRFELYANLSVFDLARGVVGVHHKVDSVVVTHDLNG